MRPFGEAQSKAMRAYAQSGQYYTIVESRVHLTTITFDINGSNVFYLYIHVFLLVSRCRSLFTLPTSLLIHSDLLIFFK